MAPGNSVAPGASPDEARAQHPLRVLIADDERDFVLTFMAILRDEGFEVKGVHNGRDALAAIAEFDPDAAVIDIQMPGMTGWDVARAIRKVGDEARPVLIGCSGRYVQGADKALAQMAGFRHFLPKPCDPKELVALLKTLTARGA